MDFDVVISGGGPVGLMLAGELRLGGASVLVVERRTAIDPTVKAGSINVTTAEVLYRRGLLGPLAEEMRLAVEQVKKMLSDRKTAPAPMIGHFAGIMVGRDPVDLADPAFRDAGPAAELTLVGQQAVERVLEEHARSLGAVVRRGAEVTGFDAGDGGVTVHVGDERVRAGWLVGCDGGRSLVRKLAGFGFPGTDPEITGRQAIAEMDGAEALPLGWQRTDTGVYVHGPVPGRVLTVEFDGPPADRTSPVTVEELQGSIRRVSGVDVTVRSISSVTRFTDNARQADTYRRGRVLLAGDAAHVHSPFGGQGLNLGIGDAANLGWKLAATIRGTAPDGLLDTYTTERHPIGEWVLEWTRAQIAAMRPEPRAKALRSVLIDLFATRDGATYVAKKLSGVLHRYPIAGDHDLVGRGAPDFELADGTRLAEHCHDGSAVLIGAALDDERVRAVPAAVGRPELRALIRPDGHVAWAREDGSTDGLDEAFATWFGAGKPADRIFA
ncbi:2-polyprenyl-6-methoxyphenol hydroxylase-like FAD-dependent oxidoreductase [Amycolatopsis endophytica]|uniref:2-polyprenyl-6-methoxyphenol hydroxylase-like FAD-dependent oxidoreductase n=1 Tax=Amycolatopsis endophytica TaxID=860233 RepID=A0A853B662_9PSEU|nr:FAD-dependent monooxygenase [Amycolatopsis endophytica]NYI90036.1 2-polyprenyl-6-methoxyphenol hydroxylase-like FAD-dependent oxidoreductase [Amycolatopsis endophytica]